MEKLIPRFVTNLLSGEKVPLYGEGWKVREWLHADDHCRAIHRVPTGGRAGEVYDIAGE
ncbi:NAD-dependent epimerase/dehydratase family protein [Microbispora sp. NPDC049125]|uniref:NAD-dependent epimerase/dehydratase family protein n=1 Tax=Microbispora sp. NPDC049125 TaxID=3154929 RepID=UPI00346741F0